MALTPEQFARTIAQALQGAALQLSLVAAKAAEAELKRRVFNEGLSANLQRIGQYSTEPARFSEEAFIVRSAFRPTGGARSVFVANGYKGLRELNGRQTAYVDLSYTGSLMGAIKTVVYSDSAAVVIEDAKEAVIAEANEKRFGKRIFVASKREEEAILNALDQEIEALLMQL